MAGLDQVSFGFGKKMVECKDRTNCAGDSVLPVNQPTSKINPSVEVMMVQNKLS